MIYKDVDPLPISEGSHDHGITEPGIAIAEPVHDSQDTPMVRR